MKNLFAPVIVFSALLLAGCARDKTSTAQYRDYPGTAPSNTTSNQAAARALIVTPNDALTGKVSKVDSSLRFAVLTFPVGHMPDINRHLSLYRRGLKVGEVNVTGPQRGESIVADITAGDAEPGDEVKER